MRLFRRNFATDDDEDDECDCIIELEEERAMMLSTCYLFCAAAARYCYHIEIINYPKR